MENTNGEDIVGDWMEDVEVNMENTNDEDVWKIGWKMSKLIWRTSTVKMCGRLD